MAYPMYQPNYYPQGAMPDQLAAFRAPYQPQYQQPMMQSQAAAPQGNGMNWVQGEAGAKAYPVAPGASVVLWDSESPLIYIKSADQTGIPSMRVLEWKEYHPAPPMQPQSAAAGEYASADSVRALEEKMNALSARIDMMARDENHAEVQ